MAEATSRTRRRTPRARAARRGPSILFAGLWAAVGASLAGLAVAAAIVLVVWGADSHSTSSTGQALIVAVRGWLLAHHGTLSLAGQPLGLVPLGLMVFPAMLLARAGGSLARLLEVRDPRIAAQVAAGLAGPYATGVALLAALTTTPAADTHPLRTGLTAGVLAFCAGGIGTVRAAGLTRMALRSLTPATRLLVRAGAVALGTLLAAGALMTGLALLTHLTLAADLSQSLGSGVVGGAVLLLFGVCYAPNTAVWAASVPLGPGFAVGTGTSVSFLGVNLGPVPAFPLLAALPQDDRIPPMGYAFVAAPVLAGVLAGLVIASRMGTGAYGPATPWRAAMWGGLAGVVTGIGFGLCALLAGGPLGTGRLTAIGPSPWRVGVAAAVWVGVLAALTAAVARWIAGRSRRGA